MSIGQGNPVWKLAAPAAPKADHGLGYVQRRAGASKLVKVKLHHQPAARAMNAEMPAGERR
jgi:hypothetical protein